MITFLVTLLIVAGASGYMGLRSLRTGQLLRVSCAAMVDKMYYVKFSDVCFVAQETSRELPLEQLIVHLGGLDGLHRMRFNAKIMFQTAKYLTLIDPEGHVIAQQLRRDATELRRLALIVLIQHRLGLGQTYLPRSVQHLSALYVAVTNKHVSMCSRLIDDVLLLTRLITSTQANIIRTGAELQV